MLPERKIYSIIDYEAPGLSFQETDQVQTYSCPSFDLNRVLKNEQSTKARIGLMGVFRTEGTSPLRCQTPGDRKCPEYTVRDCEFCGRGWEDIRIGCTSEKIMLNRRAGDS